MIFSLTIGFGFIVQRDYQNSWQLQKGFWGQVVDLAPDISKGTVILVDPEGLQDGKYIGANTWNLPMVLEQVFNFPTTWEFYDIPRVYRLTPDWDHHILGEEGLFHLNANTTVASRSYDRAVDPNNVILFSTDQNQLIRIDGPIQIMDTQIVLKTFRNQSIGYSENTLYPLLIEQ
jgi:hypothetical protein